MKRAVTIVIPTLLFVFSMAFMFDAEQVNEPVGNASITSKLEMPDNIKTILDKSCMGCHNDESSNAKGKMKLNFSKFSNGKYSTGKQIAKLNGIVKTLEKGKMPPKKFKAKYPDHVPTSDEVKLLSDWAKTQASALAGE